jgi:hypothetical protein
VVQEARKVRTDRKERSVVKNAANLAIWFGRLAMADDLSGQLVRAFLDTLTPSSKPGIFETFFRHCTILHCSDLFFLD